MSNNPFEHIYFKGLAETLPHFIIVVDATNYKVQYINRINANALFENHIGMSMFEFVLPDHVSLLKQKLAEVKQTGVATTTDLLGTSSNYADKRAWYNAQISPVKNTNGQIESLIFIVEDITAQKLSEVERINTNERLKAIINNTEDIICSIDKNFDLVEFNSVFIKMIKIGYGLELKPGMSVLAFTDPNKHERLIELYKRVLQGEHITQVECFGTITNKIVYNETNYNPIYDANKQITGINIFSKDITERIKSEQKIKATLHEKEILLSEIHHRIKNNLAMISSLLKLQEINTFNEEAKEVLTLSRKRIKSTALIHELLYKSESFQNIDFGSYLMQLFQHFKINENICLTVSGDTVTLNIDVAMPLGLMLNEIMLNSFKHSYTSSSKGKIKINLRLSNNLLLIEYTDFEGIFPDSIDFDKANTTGLTLIHTFTEQLNGKIELVNKKPPTYSIQLPLHEKR